MIRFGTAVFLVAVLFVAFVSIAAAQTVAAQNDPIKWSDLFNWGMLIAIMGGLLRIEGRITKLETEMRFALNLHNERD
jgi:hypothetical protein